MIEQLFEFVRQNSQREIVDNPAIPNEQNEAVMQEASQSILDGLRGFDQQDLQGLQQQAEAGQLNENDPRVQQITQHFSSNLSNKFGLDNNAIKALAIALIPLLLKRLMGNRNTNAQAGGGGFNLESILGGLLGGGQSNVDNTRVANNGGMMDQLSNMGAKLGLDKDGDGKVGLNDFLGK